MPATRREARSAQADCRPRGAFARVGAREALHAQGAGAVRAKIRPLQRDIFMDIERINAIGANLQDLTERTQALRGYL